MMDDITKIQFERFNEDRKNLLVSLNIINIFVLVILFTVFIPYTTYVRNLLSIRIRQSLQLIQLKKDDPLYEDYKSCCEYKAGDEIKRKLYEEEKLLIWGEIAKKKRLESDNEFFSYLIKRKPKGITFNEKEINANFDLIKLQEQWLNDHEPSSDNKEILDKKNKILSPVGEVTFGNAELSLLFPVIISLLITYSLLCIYEIYQLKLHLKKENLDISLIQLPWLQINLSLILLYTCLIISIASLCFPPKNIPFRLGKIITQENSYQIAKNLDLWIVGFSIIVAVGSPLIFLKYSLHAPSG